MENIIGSTINGFVVLDCKSEKGHTYLYVKCPFCKCNKWIRKDSITGGKIVSCGCYNKNNNFKKSNDITGRKFGKLKALCATEKRSKYGSVIWHCSCECGKEKDVAYNALISGNTKSCGCMAVESLRNLKNKSNGMYCKDGSSILRVTEKKIHKNNSSGFKGVSYDKTKGKWRAQITFKGENYYLGRYYNIEDAVNARKIAEEELFGNFIKWYSENYPENWERLNKRGKKD